jgi:hypothetical protein
MFGTDDETGICLHDTVLMLEETHWEITEL